MQLCIDLQTRVKTLHDSCCADRQATALEDPLAELHMEDYDTDDAGEEMNTETASRLFGSGNPGTCISTQNQPVPFDITSSTTDGTTVVSQWWVPYPAWALLSCC